VIAIGRAGLALVGALLASAGCGKVPPAARPLPGPTDGGGDALQPDGAGDTGDAAVPADTADAPVAAPAVVDAAEEPDVPWSPEVAEPADAAPDAPADVAPPWTPRSLSGLTLWLDARAGVITDVQGRVERWEDQSGKGNHALQGVAASRPILVPGSSGGRQAVAFGAGGASGVQLEIPDNDALRLGVGDFAVWIVHRLDSPAPAHFLFKAAGIRPFVGLWMAANGFHQGRLFVQMRWLDLCLFTSERTYADKKWRLFGARRSAGTAVELRLDGARAETAQIEEIDISAPGANLTIGGAPNDRSWQLHGEIAEIVMVSGALTEADRRALERYLLDKHGLPPAPEPQLDAAVDGAGEQPDGAPEPGLATPRDLPGLALWLDAATGLFTDATGKVERWEDQSGGQNHARQPDAKWRPDGRPAASGEAAAVVFGADGVAGHHLVVDDGPSLRFGPGDFALWAVVKPKVVTKHMTILRKELWTNVNSLPFVGYGMFVNDPAFVGALSARVRVDDVVIATPERHLANGQRLLFGARRLGSDRLELRVNGAVSVVATKEVADANAPGEPLLIGDKVDMPYFGEISEIVAVRGPLREGQIRALEALLLEKYHLPKPAP
jgi:hypothetical protein